MTTIRDIREIESRIYDAVEEFLAAPNAYDNPTFHVYLNEHRREYRAEMDVNLTGMENEGVYAIEGHVRDGADGIKTKEEVHPKGKAHNDVKFFRNVRNVLTHNPKGCKPLIELTDEYRERFTSLCSKLMSSASQISVQEKEIYKRAVGNMVIPTIAYMKEKVYSYVPIVNGKGVWSVFSESVLFNIVGDGKMEYINDDVQCFNIANYISEYSRNGVFDFVCMDEPIDDIRRRFSEASENGRNLQFLYITKTGDKNGDLVGLITVWEVANL